MNFRDANILITGGAGFIGSNLALRLARRGARITIVDSLIKPYGGNLFNIKSIHEKVIMHKKDICNKKDMNLFVQGQDYIFHLAAQTGRTISMDSPFKDLKINCEGTLTLLEAMRRYNRKAKLIYASSRGAFGKPTILPVTEDHLPKPRDIYGANKYVSEIYCTIYSENYGIEITTLRLNNVYGPRCQIRSNHYGTINLFISYALHGKTIPIYGDGNQTRDYVYINDVISAFIKASNIKENNELFLVGSEIESSLIEVVNIIKKFIPTTHYQTQPFPQNFSKIDFSRFVSNSSKIRKILGWNSTVSLEEGIKKTVQFYKKNLHHYV